MSMIGLKQFMNGRVQRWLVVSLMLLVAARSAGAGTNEYWAYVGTYTTKGSKGIYVSRFDAGTGTMSPLKLAAVATNPCFLAVRPGNESLISAAGVATNGRVLAYGIDRKSGALQLLNERECGSKGICHVSFDGTGKYAFAASYGSAQIFAWQVGSDGRLGDLTASVQHSGSSVNRARQASAHAHQIITDPGNRFVFVCDLGMDKVMAYRLEAANGSLSAAEPAFTAIAAGSGPRHLAFAPGGRFAYLINEMGSTVTAFAYAAETGRLSALGTYPTLPAGFTNSNTGAEMVVHPSGKYLYASNRGLDSVAIFAIDPVSGLLTPAGQVSTQGRTPRFMTLDPTGNYLLVGNQDSGSLVEFRVRTEDGGLVPTGQVLDVNSPVSVVFVPVKE